MHYIPQRVGAHQRVEHDVFRSSKGATNHHCVSHLSNSKLGTFAAKIQHVYARVNLVGFAQRIFDIEAGVDLFAGVEDIVGVENVLDFRKQL